MRATVRSVLAFLAAALALGLAAPAPADDSVPLDLESHLPLPWLPATPINPALGVLPGVGVFNVYWDSNWNAPGENPGFPTGAIDNSTRALLQSNYFVAAKYADKVYQYGVPRPLYWTGSARAISACGAKPAATINSGTIADFIACEEASPFSGVPVELENTIYNVIVPQGTTIVDDYLGVYHQVSCTDYGGYHFFTLSQAHLLPPLPAGRPIFFTVIPANCFKSQGVPQLMAIISHEVVEAATDPVPLAGWYDTSTARPPQNAQDLLNFIPSLLNSGEASDVCENRQNAQNVPPQFQNVPFKAGGVPMEVASYWSNEDHACVVGNQRVTLEQFQANGPPASSAFVLVEGVRMTLANGGDVAAPEGAEWQFPAVINLGGGHLWVRTGGDCGGVAAFEAGNTTADSRDPTGPHVCNYVEQFHVIGNGTIQLGLNETGDLNYCCPGPRSPGGNGVTTTDFGLRYLGTGSEATADGCPCEGWGAADATSGVTGYANESLGTRNVKVIDFRSTAQTAVSVTEIDDAAGNPVLRVTHDYHPSPATPNLYEVTVTIENVSADPTDLRYRRVMDWDIEPTAFDEYVTIDGSPTPMLLYSSDNGFASADPLSGPSFLDVEGPPGGKFFVDNGPDDHGALFDFGFGKVAPGDNKRFTIYYGAAGNEDDALAAVAAVGAEVWSFGQPDCPSWACPDVNGPRDGRPNTFIFAFGSIGGAPFAGGDSRPPLSLGVFGPATLPAGGGSFTVRGAVRDIGSAPASGITERIVPGPGLTLTGADAADLGTLGPGDTADHSWALSAPSTCDDATYDYDVYADYDGRPDTEPPRHVHRTLTVLGTCGRISGTVFNRHSTTPLAGAEVDVCATSCVHVTTDTSGRYAVGGLADSTYAVTARSPADEPDLLPQTETLPVSAGHRLTKDFVLTGPSHLPPGDRMGGEGWRGISDDGVPVVYWSSGWTLAVDACAGGASATYRLAQGDTTFAAGDLAESPAGTYTAAIGALYPDHGYAQMTTTIACADGSTQSQSFDLYVDPSGLVKDSAGAPVEGATVTLLRRGDSGAFEPVPDGSGIMSPENRRNADTTDAFGRFGWDVLAGTYRVRVEKPGCASAESDDLSVPPPVTGLELDIVCDTIPPTTTATPSPAANANGWWKDDVSVQLAAVDNPGGTGVASITYSLAGASSGGATVDADTATVPVSAEGTTTITYRARDRAGNVEDAKTLVVRLDRTPPQVTMTRTPDANGYGWNNGPVTVRFEASDALSGIDGDASVELTLTREGAAQGASHEFADLAGNTATATAAGINIDETPPTLACGLSPNVLWPPNHRLVGVAASVLVRDALSGPAGFELVSAASTEPDNGLGDGDLPSDLQGWTTGTPDVAGQLRAERSGSGHGRTYTLSYSGSDRAGNTAGCSPTVFVPHD